MQNRKVKILLFALVLIGMVMLWLFGCSKPSPEGISPANKSPKCFLSNIPTEGEKYSANPLLHWFATDADGFIREYRYIVKKAADINDDPLAFSENVLRNNSYSGWTRINVDSVSAGQSATSETIRLYAVIDPSIYTKQYFFIQAIDNHGAVSKFADTTGTSNPPDITAIAYRMFSRNNHAPETHMSFNSDRTFFSLPDTTALYRGVSLGWSGSDSLDYPRAQPSFQYHWQLYGPFDSIPDTSSTSYQTPSKLVAESYDSVSQDVWVGSETVVLFDLYRNAQNYHDPAKTRSGYFIFVVTARDDAFVSDPTPSLAIIKAVDPKFEEEILILDNNTYIGTDGLLQIKEILDSTDEKIREYQEYYRSIFAEAGYPFPKSRLRFYSDTANFLEKLAPPPDSLVMFKLIVNICENWNTDSYTDAKFFNAFSDYLSVGGRMMFIGWNSFLAGQVAAGQHPLAPNSMARRFFDILAEYSTKWNAFNAFAGTGPSYGITPEEFIKAEGLVSDLPAVLEVDSNHLQQFYISDKWWDYPTSEGHYPFKQNAEPWVGYYVKNIRAQALYICKSIYADPRDFPFNQESIDGKVCGVRLRTDTYRTAAFSFSFYCMKHDQAVAFIRGMMNWFLAPN